MASVAKYKTDIYESRNGWIWQDHYYKSAANAKMAVDRYSRGMLVGGVYDASIAQITWHTTTRIGAIVVSALGERPNVDGENRTRFKQIWASSV